MPNLLLVPGQLAWCALRRALLSHCTCRLGRLSNQQIVKYFVKEASVGTVLLKKAKGRQPPSQAESMVLASLLWDLAT